MNDSDPNNGQPQPDDDRRQAEYRLAVRIAFLAGVFSVLICGLLLLDYIRRTPTNPSEAENFVMMKELLRDVQDERLVPRDETVDKEQMQARIENQIRVLDEELREDYFRQRRFAAAGAILLAAGVIVMLLAARAAATLQRRLPSPQVPASAVDRESGVNRIARWAVAGLSVILVLGAVALGLSFSTNLPDSADEVAQLLAAAETGDSGPVGGTAKTNVDTRPPKEVPATKDNTSEPAAKKPNPSPVPGTNGEQQLAAAEAFVYPSAEEVRNGWLRFRGPGGSGISPFSNVPQTWDAESGENIVWKTPVPLPGNNSPVVCGRFVFLSGATEENRQVVCFDAQSGTLRWQREVPGTPESTAEPPEVSVDTGFAAPTMVTNGRWVFAMFANGDVAGYDYGGNLLWARSLGIPENVYGHAASLAMYKDKLLIQFDQGGSARKELSRMLALDAAFGTTVWEVPRPVPNSWGSPIVFQHGGRDQLVACGDPWVISYNPDTGEEIWRAKGLRGDCGVSPVFADGLVHAGNEYCDWFAIRADGEGDVTETHVAWTAADGLPDMVSPLVTNQFVLLMPNYSSLTCLDVKTGEMLWEEDFDEAEEGFVSSPSLVGNLVYLFGRKGRSWVVEPTREKCKRVAQGNLGEVCATSPAFQDGRIYIRGEKHLFCLGAK